MINIYETTQNSYYYLKYGENRDNFVVNVEKPGHISVLKISVGTQDMQPETGTIPAKSGCLVTLVLVLLVWFMIMMEI